MLEPEPDPLAVRLGHVLAGLRFPATRWQLVAQADYYGADSKSEPNWGGCRPGCIETSRR